MRRMTLALVIVLGMLFCGLGSGVARADAIGEDDARGERIAVAARTLGYLRYFHPSDESRNADWDSWGVRAAMAAVRAADGDEFEDDLAALIAEVAPTAELGRWDDGKRVTMGEKLPAPEGSTSYCYWRHRGVAHAPDWINWPYVSMRPTRPLDEAAPEAAAPSAGERIVRPVGDGLWISVPLATYADDDGTLPRLPGPAIREVSRDPDELPVRIAALMQSWALLRHFYPYFDIVGTDWDAALLPAARAMLQTNDRWEGLRALNLLIAQLRDGHGGAHLGMMDPHLRVAPIHFDWAGDELVVVACEGEDAPPPGSIVTAFNGRPVRDVLMERSQPISSATPGWTKYVLATGLPYLPEKSVEVAYQAPCGAPGLVRLETRPISMADPRPRRSGTPRFGEEIAPGVRYVDLVGLTDRQLRAALPLIARMDGLIIDLRCYPDSAGREILRYLTDENIVSAWWRVPLIFRPDGEAWEFEESRWDMPPLRPRISGRIVFITDGSAMSYAESVMGIVEKLGLGEIVGEPTAGTNGNINPFSAAGGYRVIWTGMRVEKHDRTQHHGVGALPTVYATRTRAGIAEGRDEQLEVALALAEGRLKGPVLDGVDGPLRWDPATNTLVPTAHPEPDFEWPGVR